MASIITSGVCQPEHVVRAKKELSERLEQFEIADNDAIFIGLFDVLERMKSYDDIRSKNEWFMLDTIERTSILAILYRRHFDNRDIVENIYNRTGKRVVLPVTMETSKTVTEPAGQLKFCFDPC